MKKNYLIFLVVVMISSFCYAKDASVSLKYSRKSNEVSWESGQVYYDRRDGMYILLESPVRQYIKMIPECYIYFYPDENIALKLNNRSKTFTTAALQLFLNTGSEDMGLSEIDFSLTDHVFQKDTLKKTWEIRGKKKKEYIRVEVYIHQNNVIRTVSFDGKNKIIKKVLYSNWVDLNNYAYPLHIQIYEDGKKDDYYFTDLKLIQGIPDSIAVLFELPDDCEIYEYQF